MQALVEARVSEPEPAPQVWGSQGGGGGAKKKNKGSKGKGRVRHPRHEVVKVCTPRVANSLYRGTLTIRNSAPPPRTTIGP